MSKFNRSGLRPAVSSPVVTEATPSGRTFEGAPGYVRDTKGELFLLSVANMVGESSFYENAGDRDDRYRTLIRQIALDDPAWLLRMLTWLRAEGNMRSASLVGACEMVRARLEATAPPVKAYENDGPDVNRAVIGAVCQRADEPAELLAYWLSTYGKTVPIAVKRGLADAIVRLYNERSLLKYDNREAPLRFGDVIEIVQPRYHRPAVRGTWREALYRHAIERRHDRGNPIDGMLPVLAERRDLFAMPVSERRAFLDRPDASEALRRVGVTHESLAPWLQGPMDAQAWETIIPNMGIFALVRNLRNFDQAGVSDDVAQQVAAKLADPDAIARSRMFPFRFWAAYKHTDSLRWAHPLEKALTLSLANVPRLDGRTLILVDRSPSMFPGYPFSTPNKSDIPLAEQAAVFGTALALRAANPTLVEFGGDNHPIPVAKGGSVLKLIERFGQFDGTDIPTAVRRHFNGHDRVVIVTDEQTRAGWLPSNMHGHGGSTEARIDDLIPRNVPVYMWNMAGYTHGAAPSGTGNRHTLGGLSDAAFRLIPLLEAGRSAVWPWEQSAA